MKVIYILLLINCYTIKLFSQSIVWENTIGGDNTEWNNFIQKTNDGNSIIGGYSYSNISGDKTENSRGQSDYWLVKLNTDTGDLIWQKTIGGNSYDNLTSGFETNDGGYILGGYSSSGISGEKTENSRGGDDYWVIKLDSNRNIVWQKTYGGNGVDRLTSIISTNDGGYLISGDSDSGISGDKNLANFGSNDIWVIKINSIGNIEWQKNFGGNQLDFGGKILKTSHNTYILSGSSNSNISGNKSQNSKGLGDYWILNLDLNGNIIWQKTFGGSNGDYAESLLETGDGNFLIAGDSASSISGDKTQNSYGITDIWLLKLSYIDGNIIWQKTIGGDSTEWKPEIKRTFDSNYIILAMSDSGVSGQKTEPNKGNRDYWLIKIDSNGQVIWDKTIGGDNLDQPQSIIEINPNKFICSGWSRSNASGDKLENKSGLQDNWVIKLSNCSSSNSVFDNQTVCINQNLNLSASLGNSYNWSGPNGFNSIQQNPTIPNVNTTHGGQYTCIISVTGGCNITKTVTVQIQNTPAPAGNQNQSFCITENATLNNIAITGTDVIWYDSLTGNTVLPTSTLLQNGVTYYASQTINGCESPTRLAISIQLINTLNANNYSETICDDLNNGFEIINLSNYNTSLLSSTGNIFKYYYSLNGAQNQVTSDEVQNSNYNLSVGNNIFFVRIESPNTCFQIVTLNLTLVNKPFVNINDVMPICEGSSITINAGFGYDNYNWSTNETTNSITVLQPGNYSVTVSENHGSLVCSTTKNFTVVNSNIGTISEIITSDWTQNENTISVLLSSNSFGNYEYSLNGIDFQDNNTFYGLENGEYTVFIRDKNGCGLSSEDVYLLMYPKYFTPNGDGYNDYWRIKFSENEPNLKVTIFDRYGKLMTQFDSSSIGWNGTYQGNPMPSSDYWFLVKRENGKEYKGHFTLKR
jgi:gliding motility-associated-like protein